MREPEAIAFAGDWHGNTHFACRMIYDAVNEHGADTFVHTGDYGYKFMTSFVKGIERVCAEKNVMVYFVDGNHDDHEGLWSLPLDEDGFGILSEHVRYIPRAHRWQWWGLTFMGLGGAVSVDKQWRRPLIEWWPTEEITGADYYKAINGGPVDVMVAHDCPSGVPIPGITRLSGLQYFPAQQLDEAEAHRILIRDIVDQVMPKLYVHGHYHRAYTYEDRDCRYIGLDCDGAKFKENILVVRNRLALEIDYSHSIES